MFRVTCTSITSRKLHLKSSRSSNSLQKPHTEPILCFDCIPIVVFDNPEEVNCSNAIDASSARLDSATVHYTTQNDFPGFPVPLFIANIFLSLKNRFRTDISILSILIALHFFNSNSIENLVIHRLFIYLLQFNGINSNTY